MLWYQCNFQSVNFYPLTYFKKVIYVKKILTTLSERNYPNSLPFKVNDAAIENLSPPFAKLYAVQININVFPKGTYKKR